MFTVYNIYILLERIRILSKGDSALNNENRTNRPNGDMNGKFRKFLRSPWIYPVLLLVILALVSLIAQPGSPTVEDIPYSDFLVMMKGGAVDTVEIVGNELKIKPRASTDPDKPVYYRTRIVENEYLTEQMSKYGVTFSEAEPSADISILDILLIYGPSLLMTGLLLYWIIALFRAGRKNNGEGGGGGGGFGAFGFGKSSAKLFNMENCDTRFHDVAGQQEAKDSLIEIVDILKNPTRYTSIGAQTPRGALLVGPPGTGKTLLAKAVAGEAGCPFFFVSGSAFVEMFVGAGAARVRDLFKQASQKAPCIIFIDEIDAIGKKRDSSGFSGNDEREQTLNQLLAEMDGFDPDKGIMVLGATNRPEILDKVLLRPGRFDRRIPVELPDMKGRQEILEVHARNKTFEPGINLKKIADLTPGASGAELANILNEAALTAVRAGRNRISQGDLEYATEYVIAGSEKKSMVISPEEKRIIAYHEIGHALVAAKQKNAVPVRKITIIPRTSGALGFTMQADEEEHVLMKKEDLLNRLEVLCAGRAAEELIFGTITSGAANDIERATEIARSMITRFGMSEEIGFVALDTMVNPYLDGELKANCSAESSAAVDREIRRLIQTAYDKAMATLRDNAAQLNSLSEYLLMNENITGDEFKEVLNKFEQRAELVEDAE